MPQSTEETQPAISKKGIASCPNCKGKNLLTRQIEVKGGRKVVLKKPRIYLDDLFKQES